MDAKLLRERTYRLCKEQHIPITKLEDKIGAAHGSIIRWDKSMPSISKVYKAAEILGVSIDYLIGNSDIMQTADEVLSDPDIISIQRSRQKMSCEKRKKMMNLLNLSFDEFDKEDKDAT